MSDPQHAVPEAHEGPIKTPRQLVWAVVASFVVPIVIIVLLVKFVATGDRTGAGSAAMDPQAVAQRIAPVARIELRDASDVAALKTGEQVYQLACAACHNAGAAGAPRLGDTAAWTPRIATGYEALLNSALKGKGAMAAQGGGDYSDLEIARSVVHLVNQSGGRFEEPAVDPK
jgi:cytochrome c5